MTTLIISKSNTGFFLPGLLAVEVEIKKALEDSMNRRIFPDISKLVLMDFEYGVSTTLGLVMSKEELTKFRDWLKSKGFTEVEFSVKDGAWRAVVGVLKPMLLQLGYDITIDDRRRGLWYVDNDGKKAVIVNYTLDDVVVIYRIIYYEKS